MDNQRTFRVTVVLPWILGAAALLVYLVTLNHWLSIGSLSQPPYAANSLGEVARVSGWTWQPALLEPLYWIVTYPLHWLPERLIPIGLNLLSVICATFTLGLLARSVAILPHDRTEDQRSRQKSEFGLLSTGTAWIPPVVAVIVCGLQLSFWEHATVASGEIFKLLLFAYVVRCVLEYRLDEKASWLYKATFVFAAALTNSWGMIGYLPLFIAALIWVRGWSFFNLTFLSRTALLAVLGLLFYLVLPTVVAATSTADIGFWQALKYNLGSQKGLVSGITFSKYTLFMSERPLWVLGLPSLLPLLIMSIRWPSYFGDPSRIGMGLATIVFHFFHGILFVICLWVMLDPQFSPRHLVSGTPLLSIYYLCALGIGYFVGYFLLVFGVKPGKRSRSGLPSVQAVDYLVLTTVGVLVMGASAALVYRNLPAITALNGPFKNKTHSIARQYADACVTGLPSSGGILLSDDIRKLTLVRAALVAKGIGDKFLYLDTRSLKWPDYHAFLEAKHPKLWKNYVPKGLKGEIEGSSLTQVLFQIAQNNTLYYLHPSFGYYFEAFWIEPLGLVYKLNTYPPKTLITPDLSRKTIDYNQDFWSKADQNAVGRVLKTIGEQSDTKPANFADRILTRMRLKKQHNWDASLLASYYSRARNFWGVEMQKAKGLAEAQEHFKRAVDLNQDNIVAKINYSWNRFAVAGEKPPAEYTEGVDTLFEKYRSWDALVSEHGPFDEPRLCFEQGRLYVRGSLFRQAANQFQRATELKPKDLAARLWLAQVYVATQHPDKALPIIEEVRSKAAFFNLDATNTLEVMSIQTSALLAQNEPDKAEEVVSTALKQQPKDVMLPAVAAQMFMNFGHYTNALRMLDRQLQLSPRDLNALVNKGYVFLQLKRFQEAVPMFTQAMNMETNKTSDLFQSAMFNRAIANLQSGKLDESRRDYEVLKASFPSAFQIYYGLAEVAYRARDTNAAIQNYEQYLANAPTNSPEARLVRDRLKELGAENL